MIHVFLCAEISFVLMHMQYALMMEKRMMEMDDGWWKTNKQTNPLSSFYHIAAAWFWKSHLILWMKILKKRSLKFATYIFQCWWHAFSAVGCYVIIFISMENFDRNNLFTKIQRSVLSSQWRTWNMILRNTLLVENLRRFQKIYLWIYLQNMSD